MYQGKNPRNLKKLRSESNLILMNYQNGNHWKISVWKESLSVMVWRGEGEGFSFFTFHTPEGIFYWKSGSFYFLLWGSSPYSPPTPYRLSDQSWNWDSQFWKLMNYDKSMKINLYFVKKTFFSSPLFNFCAKLPFQINFIEISNFPLLLCFTREMLKFKINVYMLA